MVACETDEPNQRQQVLTVGSEVEVSSDEEGFKGAWFGATIIQYPTSSASRNRKTKRALVEYKTLVTEDGLEPLKEYVDLAHIRHLPPAMDNQQDFVEGDVVDVDYRDGWWTGVISKVLGDSKYRVFFENPPDVIEFEHKNLRFHQDLIRGDWIRPERQQTMGSTYRSGADVEVNFDKHDIHDAWFPAVVVKENEDNTYLVKYQKSEDGYEQDIVDSLHICLPRPRYSDRRYKLLEEVEAFNNFAWRVGRVTDVLNGGMCMIDFKCGIKGRKFSYSEIRPIDELKDDRWDSGLQEIVVACDMQEELEHTPGDAKDKIEQKKTTSIRSMTKQKPQSTSRIKKTVSVYPTQSVKKTVSVYPTQSVKKTKLSTSSGNDEYLNTPEKLMKDMKVEEVPLSITVHHTTEEMICSLPTAAPTPARGGRLRKPVVRYQFSDKIGRLLEENKVTKQQKDGELGNKKIDPIKSRGRPPKSQAKSRLPAALGTEGDASCSAAEIIGEKEGMTKEAELPLTMGSSIMGLGNSGVENLQQPTDDASPNVIKDAKKSIKDPVDNTTVLNQQQDGGSSHKRKRGRPRKLVIPESSEGTHQNGSGNAAEKMVVKDHTSDKAALPIHEKMEDLKDASIKKKAEVCRKYKTNEEGIASVEASENADDEDQPLSTWFGGVQCPSGSYPNKTSDVGYNQRQHIVVFNETCVNVQTNVIIPKESRGLPFVKGSPVWKVIESMPVFATVPQNPHFHPLSLCKEEYREGLAIGSMVTFSGLVERISKLQFDDPGSTFTSTLDSLVGLEKHGFDVTILRTRVNELLSIKDRQGWCLNESKDCENKMTEHIRENTLLADEMNDISKKISELQEKHALLKSKLEERDLEIGKLKLDVDSMKKGIKNAKLDFEKLAAAPLKSV